MSEPIVGYESRIEYILNGSQIIGETMYETFDVSAGFTEQYTLIYLYDESGSPVGLKYRKPTYAPNDFDCYFFEKNLQGDIIAIYSESGSKIGTYAYDAWGNCTITSNTSGYNFILSKNPFRYRGYYYDSETGYYYLQSRYYNPTWGRFLNADNHINANGDLIGYNMFAYCSNNPVMFVDPTGESASVAFIVGCVILGVIDGFLNALATEIAEKALDNENDLDVTMIIMSSIIGGLEGGLCAGLPSWGWLISGISKSTNTLIDEIKPEDGKRNPTKTIIINTVVSFGFGALCGSFDEHTYFPKIKRRDFRKMADFVPEFFIGFAYGGMEYGTQKCFDQYFGGIAN